MKKKVIPIEDYYFDLKKIMMTREQFSKFSNGVKIEVDDQDKLVRVYCNGKYKGLGQIKDKILKRFIIE